MLPFISLMLLALAVSLDGFGVGVTYGLRKIRMPLVSIAIISGCSGIIIYTSMQIGVWISSYVDPVFAKSIGGIILIGIGMWALYQVLGSKQESTEAVPAAMPVTAQAAAVAAERDEVVLLDASYGERAAVVDETGHKTSVVQDMETSAGVVNDPPDVQPSAKEVLYIELKRFGLVIQILRTPSMADMDRSGNISPYEAFLLGIALSLDAFGAGIGAALIGFTPWLTSMVIAMASGVFLAAGLRVGYKYADLSWMRSLSVFPGFVLIVMGIMKLL
ncbi:MntP/YtaF family protein [Paenibacillus sp. FSL H7-0331]|uniref:MntP/YtaF family protein n=1 Tax=Paenibacillus sp. FSL H7-0331 TaxID=1920421 RepID=UPI00096C785B|nr:MntP/YtaF family protein [Paenibacillus sp. FSL H7-0331]OMF19446.1 sporulation membrane protein YtaF [Paenibacillus sp. FSL H7-0331]